MGFLFYRSFLFRKRLICIAILAVCVKISILILLKNAIKKDCFFINWYLKSIKSYCFIKI
ncbi:hypothetical protein CBW18_20710 [Pedobacter sp. AJM]|nr:hypothetical protein CBW18_20710 [Pedobacter sp. AJM]